MSLGLFLRCRWKCRRQLARHPQAGSEGHARSVEEGREADRLQRRRGAEDVRQTPAGRQEPEPLRSEVEGRIHARMEDAHDQHAGFALEVEDDVRAVLEAP